MNPTTPDMMAAVRFQLEWQSDHASHTDIFYSDRINFWRDIFPKKLYDALMYRFVGDCTEMVFAPGEVLPRYQADKLFDIKAYQFETLSGPGTRIEPRAGRFYPKGLLKDIANVFKENTEPFRCAEVGNTTIRVDFNHPLAGKKLVLKTTVCDIMPKHSDRGGSLTDWIEAITTGPGIQARWQGHPTEFFKDNPFHRADENPDSRFYEMPRFVNHIDDTAIGHIRTLYGKLIKPQMRVLDLMSSWTSHLPKELELAKLTGLGMNAEELKRNERLSDYLVHDLNENPNLPFENNSYDAAICSVSVEYMTKPFEIFAEIARILKPGGMFVLTFSNRRFPPKVVKIWEELHEFERMGLVMEYFLQTEKFNNISTYSVRGYPRPETDKYYPQMLTSDPVFAVWGIRA